MRPNRTVTCTYKRSICIRDSCFSCLRSYLLKNKEMFKLNAGRMHSVRYICCHYLTLFVYISSCGVLNLFRSRQNAVKAEDSVAAEGAEAQKEAA